MGHKRIHIRWIYRTFYVEGKEEKYLYALYGKSSQDIESYKD